uniref:C2H2-type domain-containing protein n=1 Tax=Anopheles dirus TaxID=7168 RepID=A0A1Y9H287_9DIPT
MDDEHGSTAAATFTSADRITTPENSKNPDCIAKPEATSNSPASTTPVDSSNTAEMETALESPRRVQEEENTATETATPDTPVSPTAEENFNANLAKPSFAEGCETREVSHNTHQQQEVDTSSGKEIERADINGIYGEQTGQGQSVEPNATKQDQSEIAVDGQSMELPFPQSTERVDAEQTESEGVVIEANDFGASGISPASDIDTDATGRSGTIPSPTNQSALSPAQEEEKSCVETPGEQNDTVGAAHATPSAANSDPVTSSPANISQATNNISHESSEEAVNTNGAESTGNSAPDSTTTNDDMQQDAPESEPTFISNTLPDSESGSREHRSSSDAFEHTDDVGEVADAADYSNHGNEASTLQRVASEEMNVETDRAPSPLEELPVTEEKTENLPNAGERRRSWCNENVYSVASEQLTNPGKGAPEIQVNGASSTMLAEQEEEMRDDGDCAAIIEFSSSGGNDGEQKDKPIETLCRDVRRSPLFAATTNTLKRRASDTPLEEEQDGQRRRRMSAGEILCKQRKLSETSNSQAEAVVGDSGLDCMVEHRPPCYEQEGMQDEQDEMEQEESHLNSSIDSGKSSLSLKVADEQVELARPMTPRVPKELEQSRLVVEEVEREKEKKREREKQQKLHDEDMDERGGNSSSSSSSSSSSDSSSSSSSSSSCSSESDSSGDEAEGDAAPYPAQQSITTTGPPLLLPNQHDSHNPIPDRQQTPPIRAPAPAIAPGSDQGDTSEESSRDSAAMEVDESADSDDGSNRGEDEAKITRSEGLKLSISLKRSSSAVATPPPALPPLPQQPQPVDFSNFLKKGGLLLNESKELIKIDYNQVPMTNYSQQQQQQQQVARTSLGVEGTAPLLWSPLQNKHILPPQQQQQMEIRPAVVPPAAPWSNVASLSGGGNILKNTLISNHLGGNNSTVPQPTHDESSDTMDEDNRLVIAEKQQRRYRKKPANAASHHPAAPTALNSTYHQQQQQEQQAFHDLPHNSAMFGALGPASYLQQELPFTFQHFLDASAKPSAIAQPKGNGAKTSNSRRQLAAAERRKRNQTKAGVAGDALQEYQQGKAQKSAPTMHHHQPQTLLPLPSDNAAGLRVQSSNTRAPKPTSQPPASAPTGEKKKDKKKVFLCSPCGTHYENWNLFLHMREVHRKHICLYCLGIFPSAERLVSHLGTKHGVLKKHHVSLEEYVQGQQEQQLQQQQQQDERPFYLMCSRCEHMFEAGGGSLHEKEQQIRAHDCADYLERCVNCGQLKQAKHRCEGGSGANGAGTTLGEGKKKIAAKKTGLNGAQVNGGNAGVMDEVLQTGGGKASASRKRRQQQQKQQQQQQHLIGGSILESQLLKGVSEQASLPPPLPGYVPNLHPALGHNVETAIAPFLPQEVYRHGAMLTHPGMNGDLPHYTQHAEPYQQQEFVPSIPTPTPPSCEPIVADIIPTVVQQQPSEPDAAPLPPPPVTPLVPKLKVKIPIQYLTPMESEESSTESDEEEEDYDCAAAEEGEEEEDEEEEEEEEICVRNEKQSPQSETNARENEVTTLRSEEPPVETIPVQREPVEERQEETLAEYKPKPDDASVAVDTSLPPPADDTAQQEPIPMDIDESLMIERRRDVPGVVSDVSVSPMMAITLPPAAESKAAGETPPKPAESTKVEENTQPPVEEVAMEQAEDDAATTLTTTEEIGEGETPVPAADGQLVVADSDAQLFTLSLDEPLDRIPIRQLMRVCLRATVPYCLYCNHARRIAVRGDQLARHLIAMHRFQATVNSITGEELLPDTLLQHFRGALDELEAEQAYLNVETFDNSWTVEERRAIQFVKQFECFQCRFVTTVHKELYLHNRKMHQKSVLLCLMCRGSFFSYSELLCHLCPGVPNQTSALDHTFRCCVCNVDGIPSAFRLMVHLRKRHRACDVCLEECADQSRLSNHVWKHKLHHLCYRCGIGYRNKADILKHLFWKHGTEGVLCKRCLQKKWPHVYHFCVPPAQFVCEVCQATFNRSVALKVHRRLHSEEERYPCAEDGCEKRFISRKLLLKHVARHEREKVVTEEVVPDDVDVGGGGDGGESEAKESLGEAMETEARPEEAFNVDEVKPEPRKDEGEGGGEDVGKCSELLPTDASAQTNDLLEEETGVAIKTENTEKAPGNNHAQSNEGSLEDNKEPSSAQATKAEEPAKEAVTTEQGSAPEPTPPDAPPTPVKRSKKKRKAKDDNKSLVDLMNLPALNLSESDSSDDSDNENSNASSSRRYAEVTEPMEPPVEAGVVPLELSQADVDGAVQNAENKEQQVTLPAGDAPLQQQPAEETDLITSIDPIASIWNNFKRYQATNRTTASRRPSADEEQRQEDELVERMLRSTILHVSQSDHDYCLMYKPILSEAELEAELQQSQQSLLMQQQQQESLLVKAERGSAGDGDGPNPTNAGKMKRAARHQSSDSEDSSDSDSSCECGSNCSCSSSSSNSSSSSSGDSDSSDTEESKKRRHPSADKGEAMVPDDDAAVDLKQEKEEELPPLPPPEPVDPDSVIVDSDLYTDESETDEEFYDEHPQRLANQLLAEKRRQLLAQTHNSGRHSAGSHGAAGGMMMNYGMVENSRPSTPSLPPEEEQVQELQSRKKLKLKKRSKRERRNSKRSSMVEQQQQDVAVMPAVAATPGLGIEPTMDIAAAAASFNAYHWPAAEQHPMMGASYDPSHAPVAVDTSIVTPMDAMSSVPPLYLHPIASGVQQQHQPLPQQLENVGCSTQITTPRLSNSSESDAPLKRSQRSRKPNKFYGYTSDDESAAASLPLPAGIPLSTNPEKSILSLMKPTPPPNLVWSKEDLPSPPSKTSKSGAGGGAQRRSIDHLTPVTSRRNSGVGMSLDEQQQQQPLPPPVAFMERLQTRLLPTPELVSTPVAASQLHHPPLPKLRLSLGKKLARQGSLTPQGGVKKPTPSRRRKPTPKTPKTPKSAPPMMLPMATTVSTPGPLSAPLVPPPATATLVPPVEAQRPKIPPIGSFPSIQTDLFRPAQIRVPAGWRAPKEGESVYCYCRAPYDEVSEMIACDGGNCRIEWFHFECVGIIMPPKGKWYCPDCKLNQVALDDGGDDQVEGATPLSSAPAASSSTFNANGGFLAQQQQQQQQHPSSAAFSHWGQQS